MWLFFLFFYAWLIVFRCIHFSLLVEFIRTYFDFDAIVKWSAFFIPLFTFESWPEDIYIDCRERGKKSQRERIMDVRENCFVASYIHPKLAPNQQPTCVLWPGMKPTIFWIFRMMFQVTEPPGYDSSFLFSFFQLKVLFI